MSIYGQNENDTKRDSARSDFTKKRLFKGEHNPKKAALFSAIVPGAGQFYNKKYWKIPIIYGSFVTASYFISTNLVEYRRFRDAYICRFTENPASCETDPITLAYTTDALFNQQNQFRKNLELSYIGMGFIYILNIVDASVDAHFFNFDVSDDLSMNINPIVNESIDFGLTLNLKIK
ncbi:MAG: DUF5683 domain-containing protein [Flavobacteriales bacterium]|nr:DUF5683 domain-containing protein [Flavobacteriales bacterium]